MRENSSITVRQAIEDVEIGFRQLEFAIKLLSFCELNKINPTEIDSDHLVQLQTGNLHFPSGHFADNDSLVRTASINLQMVFSASALVLDQAFDAIGMKPNPSAVDAASRLRLLVHMVRCAYAHGVADPRWEVRGNYKQVLTVAVEGATVTLDLKDLHYQQFEIEQIGGWENWFRIRCAAARLFSLALTA
ncbi:MAG: hypothetical protein ACREC1_00075 [Methylovirgula sp.]